jgi:hypothetical protein
VYGDPEGPDLAQRWVEESPLAAQSKELLPVLRAVCAGETSCVRTDEHGFVVLDVIVAPVRAGAILFFEQDVAESARPIEANPISRGP